jgi:hypothetical protein
MTDWGKAKCIGETKLFFDERPASVALAKIICEDCPIKSGCLDWALIHREAWGVWAGLDYQELRILAVSLGYTPPNRKEVEHGTERGWAWHRRQKLKDSTHETCQPCIDAYNQATRIRVARYRKRKEIK